MSLQIFKDSGDKKYKVKSICKNVVYAKELESDYLPSLYYLVS